VTAASGGAAVRPAGPFSLYLRGLGLLDRLSYVVLVASMGAMVIIVALQVFFRYVLNDSLGFADELSRLFFVWSMFLAMPHGIKYGIHVGIDLVVNLLPAPVKGVLARLVALASAGLLLVVFAVAVIATVDNWPEQMPTLEVTSSLFYIPVLIFAIHGVLHLVAIAWSGEHRAERPT
jgi:TRAP-type C4-dicarboxylate transport system permease small subunit